MAIMLELDLSGRLVEEAGPNPIERMLARRRPVLRTVIDRLTSATEDPHVVGVLAKIGASSLSLAQAQELSDAVVQFREAGKVAIAWAETFGEPGRGQAAYVLAAGFDEVWLQPSGSVGLMGASAASVFLRGVLDRAQIEPLFGQRHEYKGAADTFLRTGFTDAGREATGRLAASAYEQIVSAVASGRRLPEDQVRELIDRAPITAAEAREAGLVDRIGYRDAVRQAVDRRWAEKKPSLLYVTRYHRRWDTLRRARKARKPAVALVEAIGAIRTGRSWGGPLGRVAGSDTIAAAFRAAVQDDRIRAIVFRVNSPGGSYVASDTIWREVCRAREAGKPVVVSMGPVAGSGGYFVAMAADVIVAQPATLTGSIGVVYGKLRTSGLLERLGVNIESLSQGNHALMFSSQTGFSEEEWAKLEEWLDLIYDDFTDKVARERSMSHDAVDAVARGRVWTGADASVRGLVDELGGLHRAAEIAREKAHLPTDAPLRPAVPVSPIRRLRGPRNSDDPASFVHAGTVGTQYWEWGGHAVVAAALGLPAAGPLTMPVTSLW